MKIPHPSKTACAIGLALLLAACEWTYVTSYPNPSPVSSGKLVSQLEVNPREQSWARIVSSSNGEQDLECLDLDGTIHGVVPLADGASYLAEDPVSSRWWVASGEGNVISLTRYDARCNLRVELNVPAPPGTVQNATPFGLDVDNDGNVFVWGRWGFGNFNVQQVIHKYDGISWTDVAVPAFPSNLGVFNPNELRYDAGRDEIVLGASMYTLSSCTPAQVVMDAPSLSYVKTRLFPTTSHSCWNEWDIWGGATVANQATNGTTLEVVAYTDAGVVDPDFVPWSIGALVRLSRIPYVGSNGLFAIDLWVLQQLGVLQKYQLD